MKRSNEPIASAISLRRKLPRRVLRWRRWLRPFITPHNTPEEIARGLAIGTFIAFTPTIGLQLLLAYFIATLFKASRAAALIPVWITMPVTIPPIFAFTYKIGAWFVDGPSVWHVQRELIRLVWRMDRHEPLELLARFREILRLSEEIMIPMWIGGVLVGGVCAAFVYPIGLSGVRRYRVHRETVKRNRREKKKRTSQNPPTPS